MKGKKFMKKFLLFCLCILCLCGCEKKSSEKFLTCKLQEWEDDYSKNTTYKLKFDEDEVVKEICLYQKIYYDDVKDAKAYLDASQKVNAFNGSEEDCKLDDKTVTCNSCNTNVSHLLDKNRGTFNKEKEYFENQGYTCE